MLSREYASSLPIETLPSISIVVPSFNHASYLRQTLDSIINQGYPKLQIIVVDGGSSDGSQEILFEYQDELTYWVSEPDCGQANALNKGFAKATGEILAWLNSDDVYLPGALWRAAQCFLERPAIDVCYGHRVLLDEKGFEIGRWVLPRYDSAILRYADFIPQETLFWRRSIWEKAGTRIDESFEFALDWDLILRFQHAGAKFERLPFFIGGFRCHSAQKTAAAIDTIGCREMDILKKRYGFDHSNWASAAKMRVVLATFLARARIYELAWKQGYVRFE
jgi:glycosyltransferase involved in cell wall biosynthesis